MRVLNAVDAQPFDISDLTKGIGRLRVFTDIFQRALRREFLHSASALHDWDSKIRLLGGLRKAAQELLRGYQKNDLADGQVVHQSRDYLNLVECFVNAACDAVSGGRKEASRISNRSEPSPQILNRLNRALAQVTHLESTLCEWQTELGGASVAQSVSDPAQHRNVRVSLGWESRHVIDRAFNSVRDSLEGDNAEEICIQTRQLFLANYYHAALSPCEWDEKQHQTVTEFHTRALNRLEQLRKSESDPSECSLNLQCAQSVEWRLEQLSRVFSHGSFLKQADALPDGDQAAVASTVTADEDQAARESWGPHPNAVFGQLRVLLFGPRKWQMTVERQVERHVSVIGGSDALIRRDRRARGFHRILIHADELKDVHGHRLREEFSEDSRVLVVSPPRHAQSRAKDLPPAWGWERISRHSMDANWLVAQCMVVALRTRDICVRKEQQTKRREVIVERNRRESIADLACHLIGHKSIELFRNPRIAATGTLPLIDQFKDVIARIGEEEPDHANVPDINDYAVRRSIEFVEMLFEETPKFEKEDEKPDDDASAPSVDRGEAPSSTACRWEANNDEAVATCLSDALEELRNHQWLVVTLMLLTYSHRFRAVDMESDVMVLKYDKQQSAGRDWAHIRELIVEHGLTKETLLQTLELIAERNNAELNPRSGTLSFRYRSQYA